MMNVYEAILLYVIDLDFCLQPDKRGLFLELLMPCFGNANYLESLKRAVYGLDSHPISGKKKAIDAANIQVQNWVSLLSS